jgi:hypothetical protein
MVPILVLARSSERCYKQCMSMNDLPLKELVDKSGLVKWPYLYDVDPALLAISAEQDAEQPVEGARKRHHLYQQGFGR